MTGVPVRCPMTYSSVDSDMRTPPRSEKWYLRWVLKRGTDVNYYFSDDWGDAPLTGGVTGVGPNARWDWSRAISRELHEELIQYLIREELFPLDYAQHRWCGGTVPVQISDSLFRFGGGRLYKSSAE